MSYSVEIWGWVEREGLERLEERYLRWLYRSEWEDTRISGEGRTTERKVEM